MKTSLLPGERFPNRRQRARLARKCWYVRLAEAKGIALPPRQQPGSTAVIVALCPELFEDADAARQWAARRPWEIVAAHWKRDVFESRVRLPGAKRWVKVLTRTKSVASTEKKWRRCCPRGPRSRSSGLSEPDAMVMPREKFNRSVKADGAGLSFYFMWLMVPPHGLEPRTY